MHSSCNTTEVQYQFRGLRPARVCVCTREREMAVLVGQRLTMIHPRVMCALEIPNDDIGTWRRNPTSHVNVDTLQGR